MFLASVADMFARHGIVQPVSPRGIVLASFGHVQRTGIFHVAEIDGRIEGIASAIVRDRLWFLSTARFGRMERHRASGPSLF